MIAVPISTFRSNVSKYLDYAAAGETVALTKRGKVIAEIHGPEHSKEEARLRLEEIARGTVIHDVESPALEDWGSLG